MAVAVQQERRGMGARLTYFYENRVKRPGLAWYSRQGGGTVQHPDSVVGQGRLQARGSARLGLGRNGLFMGRSRFGLRLKMR
jgi:hypothetical protein